MNKCFRILYSITSLILVLLLAACQPIRPEVINSTAACTDADKIALLQAYVDTYSAKDPQAGVALFLPDGKLSGTGGPVLDTETGAYTTYDVEFNGHEEILGILQWFMESAHLTNRIHDPVVQGDTVTAPGVVGTPYYFAHAIPAEELDLTFTMQVKDCKIAHLHWDYTKEGLAALPAAAEAMARTCSDDYKLGLLQSYVSGINEFDPALAAWPYADDAHFEFERVPVLDEATQSYKSDPPLVIEGLENFKPIIDYFISITLTKSLDEGSVIIADPTLTVSTTLSSPLFMGEPWFLPVAEVDGRYTLAVNENCKIGEVQFALAAGTAEMLTKLKAEQ
jgi:hypothetical protein